MSSDQKQLKQNALATCCFIFRPWLFSVWVSTKITHFQITVPKVQWWHQEMRDNVFRKNRVDYTQSQSPTNQSLTYPHLVGHVVVRNTLNTSSYCFSPLSRLCKVKNSNMFQSQYLYYLHLLWCFITDTQMYITKPSKTQIPGWNTYST